MDERASEPVNEGLVPNRSAPVPPAPAPTHESSLRMPQEDWLDPALIALDVPATRIKDVLRAAARVASARTGVSESTIEDALHTRARQGGIAVGHGVAVPHGAIEGLDHPVVGLIRTRTPIDVSAPDGAPADLFFYLLAPRSAAKDHLLALARIARLCHSNVLLEGLRQAEHPGDIHLIVEAAEARQAQRPAAAAERAAPAAARTDWITIEIAGEQAVDNLLVELVEAGLGDGVVVDGQSLRDAMTKELPLFAGFRDLFGDPGGRRIIFLAVPATRTDEVISLVREVCADVGALSARVTALPIKQAWEYEPPKPIEAGGH